MYAGRGLCPRSVGGVLYIRELRYPQNVLCWFYQLEPCALVRCPQDLFGVPPPAIGVHPPRWVASLGLLPLSVLVKLAGGLWGVHCGVFKGGWGG